jgi:hypothetical protein
MSLRPTPDAYRAAGRSSRLSPSASSAHLFSLKPTPRKGAQSYDPRVASDKYGRNCLTRRWTCVPVPKFVRSNLVVFTAVGQIYKGTKDV